MTGADQLICVWSYDMLVCVVHLSQILVVGNHHLARGSFNLVWCSVPMIQRGYAIRRIILMLALRPALMVPSSGNILNSWSVLGIMINALMKMSSWMVHICLLIYQPLMMMLDCFWWTFNHHDSKHLIYVGIMWALVAVAMNLLRIFTSAIFSCVDDPRWSWRCICVCWWTSDCVDDDYKWQ